MKPETFKKLKLPDKPGVYFFLKTSPPAPLLGKERVARRPNEVLYIGKATSLRDRVKSYFGKDLIDTRGPLLVDMVYKADKIDWQETDSVLEAIILEANLIKKHQPKYNTKEKSDKSFNYVCITRGKLPKVLIVRGKNVEHSVFNRVFGPFPNSSQLREALKIVRKIFPFLDDKSKNYLEFYRQINLVPDLNDTKLYKQNIKNIILFFEGKKKQILKNLKKEMLAYSKTREFEKAGEIKRQIFALQHINDVALLKQENFSRSSLLPVGSGSHANKNFPVSGTRIEAYDIAHMGGKNMVGVMVVVEDGEVNKNEYRKFSARGGSAFGGKTVLGNSNANDTGALAEVLERRFTHPEWSFPSLVVVDGGVAQINTAKMVLKKLKLNIPIVSVLKDEHHKPKAILLSPRPDLKGAQGPAFIKKYKREILLANSEAHRFAITYHKKIRNKNFLK